MGAAAAGAAAVGLIPGLSKATVTRYGITFNTVLDAVNDLGMDPTGKESVDEAVKNAVADNTLIEFPPGTYFWTEEHNYDSRSNFGIRSTTGNPEDVTFVFPEGYRGDFMAVRGSDNILMEGFEVAQTSDQSTGAGLVVRADDGIEIHNIAFTGFSPKNEPSNQLYTTVETVDGVGIIDGVTIDGGGVVDTYPNRMTGIFGGTPHIGELRIRNCDVRELGSSGVRYTGGTGAVKVEDCYFENIDNGALRLHGNDHDGGKSSWVKRCEFVNDNSLLEHLPSGENYENADMLRLDDTGDGYYGLLIEDCTFRHISDPDEGYSRGCIARMGWADHGSFTVRGCTMRIDTYGPEAIDASNSSSTVPNTVTVEDTHVTGALEGTKSGSVIHIADSDESVVSNCCISTPNAGDGVLIEDSASCTVEHSDIDVPGQATKFVNSSVSTSDITSDGACRLTDDAPSVDSLSASEVETPDGDAEFDVSWDVSDAEGDLSSVEVYLLDSSGSTEDSVTGISISGSSASGTTRLVASGDEGTGNSYTVELTVTDSNSNSTTSSTSASESEDSPTVDSLSASEVETSDGDAEFDVDWSVSDNDGDLSSLDLTLTDDTAGSTEETVSVSVSGSSDSGTTRLVAAGDEGAGNSYTVSLTVTDSAGNSSSGSASTAESENEWQTLRITGTGTPTNYKFTVSGELQSDDLESWDEITDSTAEGWVTEETDSDTFEFTGEVTDFEFLEGDATVELNGTEVDPSSFWKTLDRELKIVADADTVTNYTFSVDGDVEPITDGDMPGGDWDDVTTDGDLMVVEGVTSNTGGDRWQFSGAIVDFTLENDGAVYIDGSQVDPATIGDSETEPFPHHIVFDGAASPNDCEYQFAVSGAVAKSPDLASMEAADEIEQGVVTGSVTEDTDAFRFSGSLTKLKLNGTADVEFE